MLALWVCLACLWPCRQVHAAEPAPAEAGRLAAALAYRTPLPPQEVAAIMGRFDGQDPERTARIWRIGRDPRSCTQAQFLALLYGKATGDLRASLERAVSRQGLEPATEALPFELAISEALRFDGRLADAEAYLKERMVLPLPRNAQPSGDAVYDPQLNRLGELRIALARLYTQTRPDEAQRLLQQVVDDRTRAYRRLAEGQAHGYPKDGPVWAYYELQFQGWATSMRAELLAPWAQATGRTAQALQLYRDALVPLRRQRARIDEGGAGGSNGAFLGAIDTLQLRLTLGEARMAAAEARWAQAEAAYRDCCLPIRAQAGQRRDWSNEALDLQGLAELARLLWVQGRRGEAGTLALRLAVELAHELESEFDCMVVPARGSADEAARRAETAAAEAIRDPNTTSVGEAIRTGSSGFGVGRAATLPKVGLQFERATELGLLLLDCGLPEDARAVLEPTWGLQRVIFGADHPSALRSLAALVRAERERRQVQRAAELGTLWSAGSASFLSERLWNVSEAARRQFFADDREQVARVLDVLLAAQRPDTAAQVFALAAGRQGLLARVAGEIDALARRSADPAVRRQVEPLREQLRQRRQAWASLALQDAADQPEARTLRRELDDLQARLASAVRPGRSGDVGALQAQVLAAIASDQAVIDFMVFRDPDTPERERMLAVVARGPQDLALVAWADLAALRASGVRWRQALRDNDAAAAERAAQAVSQALWQPLEASLDGVRHLVLVPDGLLNVLPLHALKDSQGRRLVEAYTLERAGSVRDLLDAPPAARPAAATALVLGAPDYGNAAQASTAANRGAPRAARTAGRDWSDLYFAPLPGALEEVQRVAAIVAPVYRVELLIGAEADKAALRRARAPALLHLATHGFYLDDAARPDSADADPLQALARSGLALAHANAGALSARAGDNGVLTALEAVSLDLHGTRLVVLSACDTALGQTRSGDGVYGLSRALREAGARAVMGSLWPVADDATRDFMLVYYRHWVGGASAAQALQATQLEFLQHPRWSDPRHWAGFVVDGV